MCRRRASALAQVSQHVRTQLVRWRTYRTRWTRRSSDARGHDRTGGHQLLEAADVLVSCDRPDLRYRNPVDRHDHAFTGSRPPQNPAHLVPEFPDADAFHGTQCSTWTTPAPCVGGPADWSHQRPAWSHDRGPGRVECVPRWAPKTTDPRSGTSTSHLTNVLRPMPSRQTSGPNPAELD